MAQIKSFFQWLMPVRNPLWVSNLPKLLDTSGTPAQWRIYCPTATYPGNAFHVTYGAEEFTFTCVFAAADSLLPPLAFLPGANGLASAQNVAAACRRNYTLNKDFVITVVGYNVFFTQRTLYPAGSVNSNSEFDITSLDASPEGCALGDTVISATNGVVVPNHSMRAAIFVENLAAPGTYLRLQDRSVAIVGGTRPELNIAGILRPYLIPEPPPFIKPFNLLHGIAATGAFRRFYVELCEFAGTPVAAQNVISIGTAAEPLTAWHAGFQQQDQLIEGAFAEQLQYTPNKRQWLTWRGRYAPTKVTRAQRHYLTHYCWADLTGENCRLEASITCTDGTVVPWTPRYSQTDPYVRYTLTIWSTSFEHLQLAALVPAGKVPASYQVRLISTVNGLALNEEKSFTLVQEDYQELHLMYFNSLGGYDPLRATGAWQEGVANTWQQTERPSIPADYADRLAVRSKSVPLGGQRTLSIKTSYLPLSEHRCVVDILNSPDIRIQDDERLAFLPLRIVKSKQVELEARGEDDENLYALELDLLAGDIEDFVTRPFPYTITPLIIEEDLPTG